MGFSEVLIGEKTLITLKVNGNEEYRRIKVIITDPNNIIRYADKRTSRFIENNLINESIFESDSKSIDTKKKISIDLNIPPSDSEIIQGYWKLNIIVLKENGDVSMFLSNPLNIISINETKSFYNYFSIAFSFLIPLTTLFLLRKYRIAIVIE